MKVIAIMNEKGGVEKTITATSLSYLLPMWGKRVCLIDFDGQGHFSIIFGVKNKNQLKITVSTLLRKIMEWEVELWQGEYEYDFTEETEFEVGR